MFDLQETINFNFEKKACKSRSLNHNKATDAPGTIGIC